MGSFKNTFFHLTFVLNLLLQLILVTNCQILNCTTTTNLISSTKNVFIFKCFSPTTNDPTFPTGIQTGTYTDLLISPNMYTTIPVTSICAFQNITLLDMSSNKLTSATNAFQSLKCLPNIKTVSFASNFISTGLKSTDFDDGLSQYIESISFYQNSIPYIESSVFIKSDGTSRFKNLKYLNLASNQLKEFDLLWPLTLSSSTLTVDLNTNFITSLTNPLSKSFKEAVFQNPMRNSRTVNIQDNALTVFNDTNLLQYGIQSASDLNTFWRMIANYDFTQSGRSNIIVCDCPANGSGSFMVTWYRQLLQSANIETAAIINQLFCTNRAGIYVLNLSDCVTNRTFLVPSTAMSTAATSAATTSTSTTSSTTASTSKSTTLLSYQTGKVVSGSTDSNNLLYLLFLLLLIPIIVLLVFLYLLFGRPVNKLIYKLFNTLCCIKQHRPGESKLSGKMYDAAVCYCDLDDNWVKLSLLRIIEGFGKPYNLRLIQLNSKEKSKIEKDEAEALHLSRRIILVFSKNFIDHVWQNGEFKNEIRKICMNDRNCVLIAVNEGDITKNSLTKECESLKIESLNINKDTGCGCSTCFNKQLKHSLLLEDIEILDFFDPKFSDNLHYVLPLMTRSQRQVVLTEREKENKKKKERDTKNAKRDEKSKKKRDDTLDPIKIGMKSEKFKNEGDKMKGILSDDEPALVTMKRLSQIHSDVETNDSKNKKSKKKEKRSTKKENDKKPENANNNDQVQDFIKRSDIVKSIDNSKNTSSQRNTPTDSFTNVSIHKKNEHVKISSKVDMFSGSDSDAFDTRFRNSQRKELKLRTDDANQSILKHESETKDDQKLFQRPILHKPLTALISEQQTDTHNSSINKERPSEQLKRKNLIEIKSAGAGVLSDTESNIIRANNLLLSPRDPDRKGGPIAISSGLNIGTNYKTPITHDIMKPTDESGVEDDERDKSKKKKKSHKKHHNESKSSKKDRDSTNETNYEKEYNIMPIQPNRNSKKKASEMKVDDEFSPRSNLEDDAF